MGEQASEIRISYKDRISSDKWMKITSSKCAAEFLYGQWDQNTIGLYESFKVILLNNANKVKGIFEVSKGSITGTMVDVRVLMAVVLKSLTVGIILAHNHPSGTLRPSLSDKEITKKIKEATAFFDVKVLDHIIITPHAGYFSFADAGIL